MHFPTNPIRSPRLTWSDASSKSGRPAKDFESCEMVSIAESAQCLLVRCPAQLVNHESTSLHMITARQARMNTNYEGRNQLPKPRITLITRIIPLHRQSSRLRKRQCRQHACHYRGKEAIADSKQKITRETKILFCSTVVSFC